jgi:apolipoprotein N-acyltransferase
MNMASDPAVEPLSQAAARSAGGAPRPVLAAAMLAARLGHLTGWRRRGLAALLGALATLALPPVHAVPLLIVAFTGLVWLMDGTRRVRDAFWLGWWFGLGHFAAGIYWVASALLTDPLRFGWMIPPVVGGLAAVLALFPAAAVMGTRAVSAAPAGAATITAGWTGPSRILVLAALWTGLEWLRGWIFSGFPWNLTGYAWAFSDAMNQLAAVTGVWGLSLVTVAAAAMPAVLGDWRPDARAGRRMRFGWGCIGAAALLLAAIWAGGAWRLAGASGAPVPDIRLRIVQAAIDPALKNNSTLREANLGRHLALTVDTPGFDRVTHVIWPETAVQFLINHDPEVLRAVATAAPPGGLLLTGAPRGDVAEGRLTRIWNSLVAVDPAGAIVGTSDKFHLVPLGEYVPLRGLLPFLDKVTPGALDFTAGPGPVTLRLPGLPPVGPLICYEVIFPGEVVDRTDRPSWLLNLTNDGWFGMTSGPYQHFVSARMRAVEEGLPLVRAANTGISGVVDGYGRVTAVLGLGQSGVIDADLPQTPAGLTVFAQFGERMLAVILAATVFLAALLRRFQ